MCYKIIDTHCDALYKLSNELNLSFITSNELQTNMKRLQKGNVKLQLFAIFIDEHVRDHEKFYEALNQIHLFHTKIIKQNKKMRHIRYWHEMNNLKEDEIGAVLTLEGADAIGNDLIKLHTLISLGVLSVGLTWNYANLCADGVNEKRGAGLSLFGEKVIRILNEQKILTDVSHLCERSFWDVLEQAHYPVATHSNAWTVCNHRRNLRDEQIKELVKKNGFIGIAFYPPFLTNKNKATISDVISHIDYMCSLGATNHIGFGSDFDGIDDTVKRLRHSGEYENVINELQKHYSETIVKKIVSDNFKKMLVTQSLM